MTSSKKAILSAECHFWMDKRLAESEAELTSMRWHNVKF